MAKNSIGNFAIVVMLFITAVTHAFANDRDKILVGPRAGHATILSISDINSDNAIVTFRRDFEDSVESCVRNIAPDGGSIDSDRVARCIRADQASARIMRRRAFCSRNTVYTELGNYSLVNVEKSETALDGKPDKSARTDWKDHRNEQIIGNCSACGTPVILDTFRVLCPRAYRLWFEDYAPH